MKNSEKLKAAKAVITDPNKWTQRAFARDKDGVMVGSIDPSAVCFCSIGAINSLKLSNYASSKLQSELNDFMSGDIADFNDNCTHAEVMAAWDRAIESALAKEGGIK